MRALLFYITIGFYTLVIGLLGLPILLTFYPKFISKIGVMWSLGAMWLLKFICKLTYKVEGKENLPKNHKVIVAAKHSTAWETMFLLSFMAPASFVLKKELTKIPIYGWYLPLLGMISISRADKIRSIKKMIRDSKDRLNRGLNVIIFPEGSRASDSCDVKPGIYSIHKNLSEYNVLPIAHNAAKFFGGKGSFSIKPGIITVKIKPEINFIADKSKYLAKIKNEISQ